MKRLALCTLLMLAPPGINAVAAQDSDAGATSEPANEQTQVEAPKTGNAVDSSSDNSDKNPDKQTPTPEGAQPSPFDYNPSEEISEDLSVSFPVDI